jgi:pimeloyl-ACP methyl ester carboxylesterase
MTVDTILLVHGAWHGGWCWDRVTPFLLEAGYTVVAPTLPGLEEDAQERPAPGLADQVQAVVEEVERAAGPVLLVGHSYGGMVITGAAEGARQKIAGLVYFDAAVPRDGQSFASHIPGIDADTVARREMAFKAMAGGGDWLPAPPFPVLGIDRANDQSWLGPLLRPHPLRTWLEPLALPAAALDGLPKTYVLATDPPTDLMGYPLHGQMAQASPDWSFREMATGHMVMVHDPKRAAELILEAARK